MDNNQENEVMELLEMRRVFMGAESRFLYRGAVQAFHSTRTKKHKKVNIHVGSVYENGDVLVSLHYSPNFIAQFAPDTFRYLDISGKKILSVNFEYASCKIDVTNNFISVKGPLVNVLSLLSPYVEDIKYSLLSRGLELKQDINEHELRLKNLRESLMHLELAKEQL